MKYLKVMFGTKSGASDYEYKLNEIAIWKILNMKIITLSLHIEYQQ